MEKEVELRSTLIALYEALKNAQSSYEKLKIYMNLGLTYLLLEESGDKRENIISALLNFDEGEKIARMLGNKEDMIEVELNKGFVFYRLAHLEEPDYNLEKAVSHYLTALSLLKETQNKGKLVNLYYNLGSTYLFWGKRDNVEEAIKYFEEAVKMEEFAESKKIVGLIYHGLGVCYYMLGKFETDEAYFENAVKNFRKSLNYFGNEDILDIASTKSHLASSILEIAILQGKESQFQEAYTLYNDVLEIYKDKSTDDYGTTIFNMGMLFLNESRLKEIGESRRAELLKKAIGYFEEGVDYFPRDIHPEGFIRINYELAYAKRELFFLRRESSLLNEVKEHIENIVPMLDREKNPYMYLTSQFFCGEAYFYTGDKKRALGYFEASYKVAESFDKELAQSISMIMEKVRSL